MATVTVTFSPDGGTVSPETKVVTVGEVYGTLPTPVRAGYTFTGWRSTWAPIITITSGSTVTQATDHSLVAVWAMNTQYTITFNAWDGGETLRIQPIPLGASYGYPSGALPDESPRTGYTFSHWFMVQPVSRIVTAGLATDQETNHPVFGIYSANDYTVSFDAQGGDAQDDVTVTYGSAYGTLPAPTRAGYVFDGWFTASSGGDEITAATTVSTAEDHTLYAQWSAATYTVSFDGQGGSTEDSVTVTYGGTYGTLPTPTRAGYTFDGWFTEADGAGTQITASSTVSITGDQTLYADWSAYSWTIGPPVSRPGVRAIILSNSDIVDADDLKTWALARLARLQYPSVEYEIDAADLSRIRNDDQEAIVLGETGYVVDSDLAINTTVTLAEIIRSLDDPTDVRLTFRQNQRDLDDRFADTLDRIGDYSGPTERLPAERVDLPDGGTLDDWVGDDDQIDGGEIQDGTIDRLELARIVSGGPETYTVELLDPTNRDPTGTQVTGCITASNGEDTLPTYTEVLVLLRSTSASGASEKHVIIDALGSGGSGDVYYITAPTLTFTGTSF